MRAMLASVQGVLSRWFYRSAFQMSAAQEEAKTGMAPHWSGNLKDLEGDDAFDTIIQVLCCQ